MALYDNPLWILSHIRNSFIVSDDTGNSELVMAGDKFPGCIEKIAEQESVLPFLKLDDVEDADDEFRPKSLEIRENTRPIGYRPRCNTEIKLEKMKRDRKNAPNIRTVSWRPPSSELSQEELDQLFPRKQVPHPVNLQINCSNVEAEKSSNTGNDDDILFRKSLLSRQLDLCSDFDSNYFSSFSQFAGGDSEEDSKCILVYLPMCQATDTYNDNTPSISAKVKSQAKVIDVIGYLCYLYTKQNKQPPLQHDVEAHSLFLADESGAVELDLPRLEPHESISRYGFTDLGLVETRKSKTLPDYSIKVTLPDGTFTVVQLPSKNITLQELMDKAMAKRQKFSQAEKFKFVFNIERSDTPGVSLDPTTVLSGVDCTEFFIVRQNSQRYTENVQIEIDASHCMSSVEASAYKEYINLKLLTRMRTRLPVILAISEDKIEIIPHQTYGSSIQMWSAKVQSRLVKFEDVVSCQLTEREDHFVICVIYRLDQNYSKLKFECCDEQVGKEINAKVKFLINDRSSEAQTHYKLYRERKIHRRKTLHF